MYSKRNQFTIVNIDFRLTCIINISSVIHKTLVHTGLFKTVHSLWRNLDRGNIFSANYLRRFRPINVFLSILFQIQNCTRHRELPDHNTTVLR
jgi:hypothetical protein